MMFIKDMNGDLLNESLIVSIEFQLEDKEERGISISMTDGNCFSYDVDKKTPISERLKFDSFLSKLNSLTIQ